MTTPNKAIKPGTSVADIIGGWNKPNAVVDPPHRRAKASGVKDPAKRGTDDKVRCRGCGEQYSKRAKWVTEGNAQCYRCSTKGAK